MKFWLYINGAQSGPYTLDELNLMDVQPDTPVWYEGLARWLPASEALAAIDGFKGFGTTADDAADPEQDEPSIDDLVDEVVVETRTDNAADASWQQQIYEQQRAAWQAQTAAARPQEPMPPTFLGWSVFLMVCCCGSPFALAALIGSIITSIRNSQGNLPGARRASEVTEWLMMIAISLGVLALPLTALLF